MRAFGTGLLLLLLLLLLQLLQLQGVEAGNSVQWRVLIVGTKAQAESTANVAALACESIGQPYTYWNVLQALPNGAKPVLTDSAGVGLYSAVVFETNSLAYEAKPGYWPSALTSTQWAALLQYEVAFGIRRIYLHSFPNFSGLTPSNDETIAYMQYTAEAAAFDRALPATVRIPLSGCYVTPADVSNAPTLNPVAYLYKSSNSSANDRGAVAAAIETTSDVQMWHFFAMHTPYYGGQIASVQLALQWALRGYFLGERRVSLSMQIDDLFLTTAEWRLVNGVPTGTNQVRATAADLAALDAYQKQLTSSLPSGSLIRYEFAVNGRGVEAFGGYDDPLITEVRKDAEDFAWVSHTYSHPVLTSYTYAQCLQEMTQNLDVIRQVWNPLPSTFGSTVMVTPAITGLLNGECLRAISDFGVNAVVGDNSIAKYLASNYGGSAWHGLWSTTGVNGFPGMFIIPRWATNVYFDNSQPDTNMEQFRYRNPSHSGWTWEQLLEFEASTVARNLALYRQDAYMFHQANVKTFAYDGWAPGTASLLAMWTEAVVDQIRQVTTLPIVSYPETVLRTKFQDRMARDACGVTATATLGEGGIPTAFNLVSTGSCTAAMTGVVTSTSYQTQQYGSDRTVYVPLTAGKPATLSTGVSQTCPLVAGQYCGAHGYCDASTNPPRCSCDAGWSGADCSVAPPSWSGNMVKDSSFEGAGPWGPFAAGLFEVTKEQAHTGTASVKLSGVGSGISGVYQFVPLHQKVPTTVSISTYGLVSTVGSLGGSPSFRLYVDAMYTDATWAYGLIANFDLSKPTWQSVAYTFVPEKPIENLWFYIMLVDVVGTVYADDVAILQAMSIQDTRPISTDGRCGFNSAVAARCPADAPCCSSAGWCGSTAGFCQSSSAAPLTNLATCSVCPTGTSGECKSASGACFPALKQVCPAGTYSCGAIAGISGVFSAVTATMTLGDISADAFNGDLQGIFKTAVAAQLGVDASSVSIGYVRPSAGSSTDAQVEVLVVVPQGASTDQVASKLTDSQASVELHQRLVQSGLGIDASVDSVSVQNNASASSGSVSTMAIVIGSVAAAVAGIVLGVFTPRIVAAQRRKATNDVQVMRTADSFSHKAAIKRISTAEKMKVTVVANEDDSDSASDVDNAGRPAPRLSQRHLMTSPSARIASAHSLGVVPDTPTSLDSPLPPKSARSMHRISDV